MSTSVKPETKLCCRFLEEDEYFKLEEIFKEHNDEMPNPKLSKIAIIEIEETEEIIGFFCFQLRAFSEPMWIHPNYRSSGLWVKLVSMILPLTEEKRTYMIATTPKVEEMCKRLGLKRVECPIYVKEP